MGGESHEEAGKEPVEELVDELIRDIMTEVGHAPKQANVRTWPAIGSLDGSGYVIVVSTGYPTVKCGKALAIASHRFGAAPGHSQADHRPMRLSQR